MLRVKRVEREQLDPFLRTGLAGQEQPAPGFIPGCAVFGQAARALVQAEVKPHQPGKDLRVAALLDRKRDRKSVV